MVAKWRWESQLNLVGDKITFNYANYLFLATQIKGKREVIKKQCLTWRHFQKVHY